MSKRHKYWTQYWVVTAQFTAQGKHIEHCATEKVRIVLLGPINPR